MSDPTQRPDNDVRTFWLRLLLTMVLLALPLAFGLVVLQVSKLAVFLVGVISAVALLAIWDATRYLPTGWMFWSQAEPIQDAATGVFNPGAWERHLAMEEDRCKRHDLSACVVAVRIADDVAAPAEVGAHLAGACRSHDLVACLDERTYAVLAIATDATKATAVVRRIEGVLGAEGIDARFAAADRSMAGTLPEAWTRAAAEVAAYDPGSKSSASELMQ